MAPGSPGWDTVVGRATGYGLDGLGIEYRRERDFPHPSRPALGPTQSPYNRYRVSYPRVNRPGRGADNPPSGAEVEERQELYLCSPSGPSWAVLGWTLPLSDTPSLSPNVYRFAFTSLVPIHTTLHPVPCTVTLDKGVDRMLGGTVRSGKQTMEERY
jgi:hypothetical protein